MKLDFLNGGLGGIPDKVNHYQLDAEVVEVAWFPLTDIRERLAYADERRLLDRLPDLLADAG